MEFDPVTVIAQIINFLLLLYLLKRFLYGPILNIMAEREERIARRMQQAREREEEADEEAREYREKRRELEERREELMAEAREEAGQRREELLEEARTEVDAIEERWHEALRDERDAFLRELRRRTAEQLTSVARRALRDLAGAELQERVTDVFQDRLREMSEHEREQMHEALLASEHNPSITSAFPLSAQQREGLAAIVREVLATERALDFRVSDELLCGLELSAGGRKVAWSIDSYIDAVEEAIDEALQREMAGEEEEPAEQVSMPPTEIAEEAESGRAEG